MRHFVALARSRKLTAHFELAEPVPRYAVPVRTVAFCFAVIFGGLPLVVGCSGSGGHYVTLDASVDGRGDVSGDGDAGDVGVEAHGGGSADARDAGASPTLACDSATTVGATACVTSCFTQDVNAGASSVTCIRGEFDCPPGTTPAIGCPSGSWALNGCGPRPAGFDCPMLSCSAGLWVCSTP